MPICCEPDPQVAAELAVAIGGDVRTVASLIDAMKALDRDTTETLLVIGPGMTAEEALAYNSELRLDSPAVGVIMVRAEVDVELLTRALQSGVREVVAAGDQAALRAACRRSREVSRRMLYGAPGSRTASGAKGKEPSSSGGMIAVFAPKGGCGKTMLSVNLGVVLARDTGQRVCVVDLALGFGDIAISVQLDPERTLLGALPMAGHLDTAGAASLLTHYRPGLDMLLAPVTPGDAERVPSALVAELLGVIKEMFDYVVVDTPPAFTEHVLIAMDAAAHHVLLTTPDVPALKNLRVTLDLLDQLSYPREIRSLVLNRADSKVGLNFEDVERVLRCPIAARLPSSRAVPLSINKGVPITLANPKHPVSQAITRLAQQWLIRAQPAASPQSMTTGPQDAGRSA
jgi:Flp pilus assembly CpaE family ATPase